VPNLIIVAGPNGAGKTSFANKHFETPGVNLYYLNADEIARGLVNARLSQGELNIRAGREISGRSTHWSMPAPLSCLKRLWRR
jgi:predicted ABC-type ATPase